MAIFRGYLPTLVGRPSCLLAAIYRAVIMAIKQEGLTLDVRNVITEEERAERDPAVIYWHKALLDGMALRTVDLTDLQKCFLEKPIRSGAGVASHIKDIYSKLPSMLISRLLRQSIKCTCGAQTNTTFPICVPTPSTGPHLTDFLGEAASVCPLCRRKDTVLSSSVPVLIFIVSQEGCLRMGNDSNRAFVFAGLEYLTIGAIFTTQNNGPSEVLSLRTGVVSPLSGEAEMFAADGQISQHDTKQFRLWLDGAQGEIEGLVCIGLFLLNKKSESARYVQKRKNKKKSAQRKSRIDALPHTQSISKRSSYTESSSYQYSYSDLSNRSSVSSDRGLRGSSKGEQKDRKVMVRDDNRSRLTARSRSPPSETTEGYQVAAVRVNRDDGLYCLPQASPHKCTCCGPATITALWIVVSVTGCIALINLILVCILFSQLR
ncbi:Hypothetical protein GLP15_2319 [Giardia lamblia P15]|uniref:Dynein beta chain, ciliary n=1 Tax=Giardia intestinalis (strain P15) TaxID=658858 RepID=E1F174_GIAIA|nr:Hypothetical protein GLP15_2319 [Giardia lamblia P15]